MTTFPRVTVIIPAYNAVAYIEEAIHSVWQQDVPNIQFIVVDDGSSDGTDEVLAGPAGRGIEVITTRNQGVAAARNEGLERARGEYIAFLDADDRWHPEKLRRQLAVLDSEPDIGTVFSNFDRFDAAQSYYPDQFYFLPELEFLRLRSTLGGGGYRINEEAFPALLRCAEIPGHTQTMLFRHSAIADLRFRYPVAVSNECQFIEDMDFCLRAFRRAPVAFINDPLTEVRRHHHNLTYDYQRLAVVKLDTLRTFDDEQLTPRELRALRLRIGRQCIAAGSYYLQRQLLGDAFHAYALGLRYRRIGAATKGLLQVFGSGLRSIPARPATIGSGPVAEDALAEDAKP